VKIFEFHGQIRLAIKTVGAARAALQSMIPGTELTTPEVYVRLKDGTELPVKAVKVRGSDRIILETFID
jgi:hypothetical protein